MSTISIIKLYDLLSIKMGKETAENLTNFIDNKINQELESKTQILATKEDITKLPFATKEDLAKLSFANKEDLAKLSLANKEDIARLSLANKADLTETKSEIMKWMFIFWVGQVLATFGLILLFIKK